ncbi:MAG: accessory gene regulator B family protein [Clostridia bacterium]|nr:accessory gene regulator B family protein [Clostridia bacterium]
MESLASYLCNQCLQRKIIKPEKQEIYRVGFELIIADIINFSLIFICGILTKSFLYSCVYSLLLWFVRRFSGGFHAKTYGVCRVVTVGTYLLVFLVNKFIIEHWLIYALICDAISIVTMIIFAPIRHPNKELTLSEIKANRFFAILTTILFSLLSILLIIFNLKIGLVISLTLLAITVLMYVGLFVNRREGNGNENNE